ncbi:YceI family protein [Patescibacteria group bacterium]|nr:YceI family protein [Patescibacteria group bacterium]MBU1016037.1 YceI family protein [Patescibacteria group bacterium]MBU1685547.1 YceI family protein [Patescibacteria group bacterium]MBU1938258.1 YceI family protein [Patescibacteria group bacterium]
MKKIALFVFAVLLPLLAGCALSEKESTDTPMESGVSESAILTDGTYIFDAKASTFYWKAFKSADGHIGGISLKRGELVVQNGQPDSGSFVIDMTSITNTDIENESLRTNLVNHLKSDDFFGVGDYPTARFDITRVTPYEGEGDYDYVVEGDLSIKDVTDSITMYAKVENSGDKLTGYAKAEVDRTKYGITIRSGSFFDNLGDQLIKDKFTLEMELAADRVQKSL